MKQKKKKKKKKKKRKKRRTKEMNMKQIHTKTMKYSKRLLGTVGGAGVV